MSKNVGRASISPDTKQIMGGDRRHAKHAGRLCSNAVDAVRSSRDDDNPLLDQKHIVRTQRLHIILPETESFFAPLDQTDVDVEDFLRARRAPGGHRSESVQEMHIGHFAMVAIDVGKEAEAGRL